MLLILILAACSKIQNIDIAWKIKINRNRASQDLIRYPGTGPGTEISPTGCAETFRSSNSNSGDERKIPQDSTQDSRLKTLNTGAKSSLYPRPETIFVFVLGPRSLDR